MALWIASELLRVRRLTQLQGSCISCIVISSTDVPVEACDFEKKQRVLKTSVRNKLATTEADQESSRHGSKNPSRNSTKSKARGLLLRLRSPVASRGLASAVSVGRPNAVQKGFVVSMPLMTQQVAPAGYTRPPFVQTNMEIFNIPCGFEGA